MKVLEIKNNLVKISYDIDDNLALSGFVIIEDVNCPYVAQVVSLKSDGTVNSAIVKLLFTFDKEGVLKNYDGTIPSIKASVSKLPSNELLDVLPIETPIKLGALAQQNIPLFVDKSIFENNLIICSNKQENTNSFVYNMLTQLDALNQKTVVIDVDGEFDYENKFEFGYDFKLPLNYTSLNYIFDHDLGDVDAKSKAVIQDIFYEVQEYSKTLPLQFIPFDTFLQVVDTQYRETHIPELVLLKNKLLKYKEENIFALNSVELTDLADTIKNNYTTVLNISKVDGDLQKLVISYIYDVMSETNTSVYSIIKLNNYNAGKKLIKRFLEGGNIATTIICGHEFKYLQELKQVAQNFIFFAPLTVQHDFAAYNTYLAKLNPEEFVVFGDATQEIPLIAEIQEFSPEDLQQVIYEEVSEDENDRDEQNSEVSPDNTEYEETQETPSIEQTSAPQTPMEEVHNEDTDLVEEPSEESLQKNSEMQPEEEIVEEVQKEPVLPEEENIQQLPEAIAETEEQTEEAAAVMPEETEKTDGVSTTAAAVEQETETAAEQEIEETEEKIPLNPQPEAPTIAEETAEQEIVEDIPEEPQVSKVVEETSYENTNILQEELNEEVDEEQIVKDVDDIFYNKKDVYENIPPLEDDEDITEDDLNLIDNLNNAIPAAEGEETELNIEPVIVEDADDEIVEETSAEIDNTLTTNEEPPIIPVYPADDIPQVSSEVFEPGETVTHPKYGTGVVEKMIKYGNKVLCSINFENVGRRLLDPAISEIKKIENS